MWVGLTESHLKFDRVSHLACSGRPGWLVGFYGMSTLVGLFYAENVLFYSFLMGTQFFLKQIFSI